MSAKKEMHCNREPPKCYVETSHLLIPGSAQNFSCWYTSEVSVKHIRKGVDG
jgi:hypothetical protein